MTATTKLVLVIYFTLLAMIFLSGCTRDSAHRDHFHGVSTPSGFGGAI